MQHYLFTLCSQQGYAGIIVGEIMILITKDECDDKIDDEIKGELQRIPLQAIDHHWFQKDNLDLDSNAKIL